MSKAWVDRESPRGGSPQIQNNNLALWHSRRPYRLFASISYYKTRQETGNIFAYREVMLRRYKTTSIRGSLVSSVNGLCIGEFMRSPPTSLPHEVFNNSGI